MSTVYLPRFIWLAAFCALLIALLVAKTGQLNANNEPVLSIPNHIVGESGQPVQVPVHFVNGGQVIGSTNNLSGNFTQRRKGAKKNALSWRLCAFA